MKLQFPQIEVKSSRAFEQENFALGDVRVIMELLSSKIYSRPKYIIIQEVASNARDANREAGCENTPIVIKLPNKIDDNIRITDDGPGITPERMSDVFLKYGNSTKRSDDLQTGGFGIGAKTPFTYTDTFTVQTITQDDDGRHRRTYIAHKDTGGFAKMSLVVTEPAQSSISTGTTISFAVKPKDFDDFAFATREVCRFWTPRPKVIGWADGWIWPEDDIVHEGEGWVLAKHGEPLVLIDSIPYKLRLDAIFGDKFSEEYRVLKQTAIRMFFDTGQVDVSATREDLDYKERTVEALKARANLCLDELRKKVSLEIEKADNLWEASLLWQENSGRYQSFLIKPTWMGFKLYDRALVTHVADRGSVPFNKAIKAIYKAKSEEAPYYTNIDERIKIAVYEQSGDGSITTCKAWGKRVLREITLSRGNLIVLDDIGKARPNRLRLQTLFDKNPKQNNIAVITIKKDDGITKAFLKHIWNWDQIPHVVLSTVAKAKNIGKKNAGGYTINAVKKLQKKRGGRYWSLEWTGEKGRAPEDDEGGIYVILKDGKPTLSDGSVLSKEDIKYFIEEFNEEVYGILYKYRNKVSDDWSELLASAKIKGKVLECQSTVQNRIKFGVDTANRHIGEKCTRFLREKIKDINAPELITFLNDSLLSLEGSDDYEKITRMYRTARISTDDLQLKDDLAGRWTSLKEKYPLLMEFDAMSWRAQNTEEKFMKEIIFYINAKTVAFNGGK